MGSRKILIAAAILISGCATTKPEPPAPKMLDVYANAVKQGKLDSAEEIKKDLTIKQAFGYVQPYVPVVEYPDVRMVWIPSHISEEDPDVKVGGHWVYIMVKNATWFGENQIQEMKIPEIVPVKKEVETAPKP
jgi:hypothetical protein